MLFNFSNIEGSLILGFYFKTFKGVLILRGNYAIAVFEFGNFQNHRVYSSKRSMILHISKVYPS